MFKNAFYVVATFSFMFIAVALIIGVDVTEYNFLTIVEDISRVEFPDILNMFNRILNDTRDNMDSWESFLPNWLSWLDDFASPWIFSLHLIKVFWLDVIQLIKFIINFFGAILPF